MYEVKIENKPGPADYNGKTTLTHPSIPGCDIGKGNDGRKDR